MAFIPYSTEKVTCESEGQIRPSGLKLADCEGSKFTWAVLIRNLLANRAQHVTSSLQSLYSITMYI